LCSTVNQHHKSNFQMRKENHPGMEFYPDQIILLSAILIHLIL